LAPDRAAPCEGSIADLMNRYAANLLVSAAETLQKNNVRKLGNRKATFVTSVPYVIYFKEE
jgi:hypothetical protein